MVNWQQRLKSPDTTVLLWVALCFGLTSAVYLSWLDRLVALVGAAAADWVSMVAGYLFQAAGMGGVAVLLRRDPGGDFRRWFGALALLFGAICPPTLLTDSPAGVVCFGMVMNLLCGAIQGGYLVAIAAQTDPGKRARVFGGGYAAGTVAVGLLALVGGGRLLHGRWALLIYLPLCAAVALLAPKRRQADAPEAPRAQGGTSDASVGLAFAVVVAISAVKNLGFSFPSADIAAGLVPELSRLPYAAGLLAAGIIGDRSRKNGMLCVMAALILPFIMLGLTREPIPSAICWGLDYLFFGFFSVFRAVLFLDLADQGPRRQLAPLGLMAGRIGDALGTGVGLLLVGRGIPLIALATVSFFGTACLFIRLYRRLYEPEAVHQRSEQEVFEAFCLHNDLSSREREVLRMVIDGHSNREIADALFITESTVKYHVRNVLQKAGCKNRAELQKKFRLALYPQLETGMQTL